MIQQNGPRESNRVCFSTLMNKNVKIVIQIRYAFCDFDKGTTPYCPFNFSSFDRHIAKVMV